ncbi:MAG: DJ-1/PfpI family protein [Alphaproteobacteria bacterium]|nr:DJ-1/PfpI family protein [Alphaproteobacteria bacterium]MBV8406493.1 DJ-1/PfpI family protein [Alphaproteobacteria bacterium]
MYRRGLPAAFAAGVAAATLRPLFAQAQTRGAGEGPRVGLVVHPDMILLDLAGPLTVFSLMMASIHLVWKTREEVKTDVGIPVQPTHSFESCPVDLDLLFVPGGLKGTTALMQDHATLDFLADRGARARYVTSVCTGALALGAAGLLRGHRATSHWYVRDLLPLFDATPVAERVVVDRNRITAGGVTAGLDFGLELCARMRGEDYARRVQLLLEYAPHPPFSAGSPESAGTTLTAEVLERRAPALAEARAAAQAAAARLGTSR